MKILVTGGAGFIGSNFIRYHLANYPQDQIINFDALTYAGHLSSLADISDNPNYRFVKGDITDPTAVDQVMSQVDVVVHFAAESHVDRSVIDPLAFINTNVIGTGVLLNSARQHQIKRFHHISTDEVFGQLGQADPPFSETTPINPRSPYAASKASSDLLVMAYYQTYNLPITISNCSNNYGPYHDPEKIIPRFITNLLTDQKVPLMGQGQQIRDWLHVEDHCRAISIILEKGQIGERYCIGGGEEKTNLELTQAILKLMDQPESMIEYVPERLGHDFRYAIDPTKIKSLGWSPQIDFEAGLQQTIQWYKQHQDWWQPLKMDRPVVDRIAQDSYGAK